MLSRPRTLCPWCGGCTWTVRLATQVLVLQVAVVTLTLGIAGGLLAFLSHERLAAQYEDRSLDMARAIAFAPAGPCRRRALRRRPVDAEPGAHRRVGERTVAALATEIQQRTGVLFVVITNDQGIRLSHPNRDELGKHVSTDPTEALAGHEVVIAGIRHARTVGSRESTYSRAEFESGSRRGQRRYLDGRGSPPVVDGRADSGGPCRRGVAHRRRRLGASGPAVARPDDGAAALRNGRVDTRPGSSPARHRRGRAGRRHRLEDNVRQRRGVPAARGRATSRAGRWRRSV